MRFFARRLAAASLAIVVAAALSITAGCGTKAASPQQGVITLKVDIFGGAGFGYEDLYPEYEKAHPNIKIVERGYGRNLSDLVLQLAAWFKSGTGAGDIVALEEGTIVHAMGEQEHYQNLLDYGAGSMSNDFIGWKWTQGMSPDGKRLLGLGTDVGGMAMCYRKDLFAKAGLPSDRESVGKLWTDWNSYIEIGRKFNAAGTGVSFVDSATNMFFTMLMQMAGSNTGHTFYDKSGKLVLADNPDIKNAWNMAVKMMDRKLSARLITISDPWRDAFKKSRFATVACPAWMTGLIREAAGESLTGKWDIARTPGNGGNWGGSFLAVPTQSKYPAEATKLAMFLTGAHGQIVAFQKTGNLPSNLKALDDPALTGATNVYFSDAPTGKIFAAGAKSLKPLYLGPDNQAVRDEVENALRNVEMGRDTPEAGWRKAVAAGTKADAKAKATK